MTLTYQAERDASDYFNSLTTEQRRKLAPLLEHYRLMGINEATQELYAVTRKMDKRMRGIVERAEADASESQRS